MFYWHLDQDRSYLNPEEVCWSELSDDDAATLVLSFCLTSSISNRCVFDICMVPQPREKGTSNESNGKKILALAGAVQLAVAQANSGVPAGGMAYDNATSNGLLNSTILGLVEPDADLPFWRECEAQPLGLHFCFPYQKLIFRGAYHVKGMNGGYHVVKRLTCHAQSGARTISWGQTFCDLSNSLVGGLPQKAFSVADPQDDKESQYRLCPRFYKGHWDSIGTRVTAFLVALVMSGTISSWAYSCKDRAGAHVRFWHAFAFVSFSVL